MEAIFNVLFFLVVGAADFDNGTIASDFLGANGASGNVFADTMIWTGVALLLLTLVYYFLINGITGLFNGLFKFNYWWAWLLMLVVAGSIGGFISFFQIGTYVYKQLPNGDFPPIGPSGWRFILMTVIYSMICYYLFSFLLKRWSKYAKFTPH